ncbi:Xanthine/uracil/vitamin C permease [Desulfofarcimen acetoxidans DSM 771]|uniref:Xanthine/uracil/vitamin C permease n=1 Tax=Desulfofarcimen acetoxidans (strain ATCC 49208 / DSM 771 / KCTC 5769 / VKM B-1644 / 5575) TaxID=485916 RepID=C8W216_DESAS|nr:solute carrier family 23 protein [Desulfofarcimen acetoxidans]ACV61680.1 Xanthine/uracil/vitamin C permease [Desulfofarcimen acetoxidans DSM 771]
MSSIRLKYGLNDMPPLLELLLLGLQWLAITLPSVIIAAKLVAILHFSEQSHQVIYIQKVFFVTAISIITQIFWGHRLPLIIGPATVLLIGVVASQGRSLSAIYTSIMVGGAILLVLSATGLFARMKRHFTPAIVAVILLLIAFTLTPVIMNLIINSGEQVPVLYNLFFVITMVWAMFFFNRILTGIWKSTMIVWAMLAGSLAYVFLFSSQIAGTGYDKLPWFSLFFSDLNFKLSFEPGVLISFLICFLALSINDLGSIQSTGEFIKADQMHRRVTKGVSLTGLANILSGFLGVIGLTNYSLSPGIIASTGCASRFVLIPAGAGVLILSFMPASMALIGSIPPVVIAATLIYIISSQFSSGLLVAISSVREFTFNQGLIIGLPVILGTIIAFLPAGTVAAFPVFLRPIIGNGFVVGVFTVLVMEHLIYRKNSLETSKRGLKT